MVEISRPRTIRAESSAKAVIRSGHVGKLQRDSIGRGEYSPLWASGEGWNYKRTAS